MTSPRVKAPAPPSSGSSSAHQVSTSSPADKPPIPGMFLGLAGVFSLIVMALSTTPPYGASFSGDGILGTQSL